MTTMKYGASGKTYELHQYVEPHPGMGNKDRVPWQDTCGRCGGSGVYHWHTSMGPAQGACFGCWGTGKFEGTSAVQTVRKRERERALWAEYGDELRAFHAEKAVIAQAMHEASEFAENWEAAHKEQARRAALITGFVADVGEKVTNLTGTVKVATTYDASYGYRRATGVFMIVELESGQIVKIAGTGDSLFGPERGDTVTILSGTVKSHETYKGQDQAMLTRVKLDDFEKRATRALSYGRDEVQLAIDYGYIKKGERQRYEAWLAVHIEEYEKELLDA